MTSGAAPPVWVDTDVALGASAGDVDDGFALAALLGAASQSRVTLLGISTVTGNTTAAEAQRCARRLVDASGVRVEVLAGGTGAAAEALAALPPGATLVALGPLTNVAAALRRDPELAPRVALSAVGGNLSSFGFLPPLWPHEFNLARDRPSARAALAARWRDLVLYPLDVVRRMRCDAARIADISGRGAAGALLEGGSRRWLARSRWRHGRAGFPVWDLPAALAAARVLFPSIEERAFSRPQRAFAGIPPHVRAAVSFDAKEAWRAFDDLLLPCRG